MISFIYVSFLLFFFFFFFFQAEDGIRDTSVTGVQTCALPISLMPFDFDFGSVAVLACAIFIVAYLFNPFNPEYGFRPRGIACDGLYPLPQIGRASCRERV